MPAWHRPPTRLAAWGAAAVLGLQAASAGPPRGGRGPGDGAVHRRSTPDDAVHVPGAERTDTACLPDLTTAGLLQAPAGRFTDQTDWLPLHAPGACNPTGVPGLQVDGCFPDTSTSNATHGWDHDSQFVLRIPDTWNGGLVLTGAPGVRKQYACDFLVSDFVLARGFAYASTDKGNTGPDFYRDGERPGDAVAEWHERVTQLAIAARDALRDHFGSSPQRTYLAGISNGGYLVRWQLENRPELYDGGVDWEGTLFTPDGPNLFTYLPTAVRYTLGQATAADMHAAGFAHGSEPLWPFHQSFYWGVTQKTYRAEFDPAYDPACPGATAGTSLPEILAPCPSDAAYDAWFADPRSRPVHEALARISLSGAIGKPLLTLHGTLDTLLPIGLHGDVYARMIADAQRGGLHRYYRIEGGNHVDSLMHLDPERLRPMLPCFRTAFDALTAWVEDGEEPPASATVPRPVGNGATDPELLNSCSLRSGG
ncbi:tannase/feruloyl esterase family alpha/beta hydrolase [Geodermatophilus sp. YIM 151500]|uniref:tannase/feruloyl esterase family alpha/beta hydrolase n=1 Tax=Geodermatophilus sp. YIM 151500 TaxID=2984531 RepID=UPI0021E4190D|nr:tannase/feruloyl esterase family alpha/beta hydrolase [Geodermatophilus sp. YIM 151500]MCV2489866.1 tannase/feruloyl esterase family alpha/beta hydrolase [Geodermatophilus sp. YIM 151500]